MPNLYLGEVPENDKRYAVVGNYDKENAENILQVFLNDTIGLAYDEVVEMLRTNAAFTEEAVSVDTIQMDWPYWQDNEEIAWYAVEITINGSNKITKVEQIWENTEDE